MASKDPEKRRAASARYDASEKGRVRKARYQSSEKGLDTQTRYRANYPDRFAIKNTRQYAERRLRDHGLL